MSSELETLKTDYQALKLENERLEKELTFEGRLRNGLQEALITTLKAENAELKTELGRWEATQPQNIESYMELKAENAELRAENKKLETDVFILSKTDKITIHRIIEPGNAFYQECFKKNTETIRDLQSEVARLRLGIRAAMTDLYSEASEPKRLVLVAIADQLREALNHKPSKES